MKSIGSGAVLVTIIVAASSSSTCDAYLPSIPPPKTKNPYVRQDIDITQVLKETEEALKVAHIELEKPKKQPPKTQQQQQQQQERPTLFLNDFEKKKDDDDDVLDISDILAQAEEALNMAGAQDEWKDIATMIEMEKETRYEKSTSTTTDVGRFVWDTTVSIGNAFFNFSKEQLQRPDSELSRLKQMVATKVSEIDLHQIQTESKQQFTKFSQAMEDTVVQTSKFTERFEKRIEDTVVKQTSKFTERFEKRSKKNVRSIQRRVRHFFNDVMTSPYIKVWETKNTNRDVSQKTVDADPVAAGGIIMPSPTKLSPVSSSSSSSSSKQVLSSNKKATAYYYYMEEKSNQDKLLRNRVSQASSSMKKIDASATPSSSTVAFVANKQQQQQQQSLSATAATALRFLNVWMTYTFQLAALAYMMRSMLQYTPGSTVFVNVVATLEIVYRSRLVSVVSKYVVDGRESTHSETAEPEQKKPTYCGTKTPAFVKQSTPVAFVPYFAKVDSKNE
jgi:hypothetical protein